MSHGCDYCLGDPEGGTCPHCGLTYYYDDEENIDYEENIDHIII